MRKLRKMTSRELNLRYGSPWKTVAAFCLPTVFLMLVRSLYNLIDKLFSLMFSVDTERAKASFIHMYQAMGQVLDPSGLIPHDQMSQFVNVATQYATQTFTLLTAFSVIIGMGASMHFSMAYGQRNFHKTREIAGNGFSITIIFSILMSLIVFALIFPGFHAVFVTSQMGAEYNPITEQLSWEYSLPILIGAPGFFASYYFMSILRNEGRSQLVIIMVVIGLVCSCALSLFFMLVLKMGLYGPMLGSAVGWIVQTIIGIVAAFTSRNSYINFSWHDFYAIKGRNLLNFLIAGFPNFVINIAVMISGYISTMLVVHIPNQVPTPSQNHNVSILQELMSAYLPWNNVVLSVGVGLMQGTRTMIAYNFGAQKYLRIWQIFKRTSVLMFGWFLIVFLVILGAAQHMLTVFSFPTTYAAHYHWWMVLCLMSLPFVALTYNALGFFQGINRSFICAWTSSLRSLTVNIPMMLIGYGIAIATKNPIWFFVCLGLVDFISALIIIPLFVKYWKKYHNVIQNHPDDKKTLLAYYYTLASNLKTTNADHLLRFKNMVLQNQETNNKVK